MGRSGTDRVRSPLALRLGPALAPAYLRFAFYDIAVQTTLRASESDYVAGLKMAKKWDDWMDSLNGRYSMAGMVYLPGAEIWSVSAQLVPNGVSNMLTSLALACLVLTCATGNYLMAIIATTTIGMITTIVLGFMHVVGWGLGTLESILIVIVIGFSVDYTVHLADSYLSSEHDSREAKVKAALADTGASILSGAISTLGASCPMFGAQIIFFFKFAVFIFLTVALSLIFSLGFFAAALATLGPLGEQGSVAKVYTALAKSNTANIRKIEEEQPMPRKPERLVRPVEELREIVLVLHEAFASVCGSEGTRSTMRGNWQRLFESIDEDQSGRLSFKEFRLAAKLLVRDALDFDALTALWDYIDYNGSGESTIKEFQQATYLLMLDDWEDLLTEEHAGELQGVVAQLEEAVETRHTRKKFHDTTGGTVKEAPGNWYKVFALFDITGSGLLGYEELEEVIRADYPGLGMKPAAISTNRIRGLWKAIDADRSGDVTVKEFVSFMRRHGPRMTRLMAFSQHSQVLVPEGAGATATVVGAQRPSQVLGGLEFRARKSWWPLEHAIHSPRGAGGPWVLPRAIELHSGRKADAPEVQPDPNSLPTHHDSSWIGKPAMLRSIPSPRCKIRTANSDGLARCDSIALRSVQTLQRSRIPRWSASDEPPLCIGRTQYGADTRPVQVSLELVHSPLTKARLKLRRVGPSAVAAATWPRTTSKREPLGRESLAAKFGYEPATLDGGGDDDSERHQGSHIAR